VSVISELYGPSDQTHPHLYRGVVENIDDPEMAGRIKIRIMGIHSDNKEYVKTKELPWAIPATSLDMNGGGLRNIGSFCIPSIGSHVFVFFEGGDHNFPVYFAAAPAIEDFEDYQEKEGKFDTEEKEYVFDKKSQYDDASNYSDTLDVFETKNDEKIKHPIQDMCVQTRANTYGEDGEYESPPPKKDSTDNQAIFPEDFFVDEVRVAFDGAANHDSPGYDGIHTTKPSSYLTDKEKKQELDNWTERKWGFNDDDRNHQHNFGGGSL
jgi:hypothetical protein